MRIQSNLFQFWYLTYNNNMENTGIQNNEYQTILKVKKTIKNQIIFNIAELLKVENYTHKFYKYLVYMSG